MNETSGPLLLAFGNPTVDVMCYLEASTYLGQFGLKPGMEATGLEDAQKQALLAFVQGHATSTVVGGAAMNSARVARWAGLERVAFLGAIGTDAYGQMIEETLVEEGILPLLKKLEGQKTGTCGVLVDLKTRDRTLSMVRNAAAYLDKDFLEEPKVSALLRDVSMVYITSFVLTSQPRIAAAEALAHLSKARGARLCLNLSSAGLLPKVNKVLQSLLPLCDLLFGNEKELLAWGELNKVEPIDDLLQRLPENGLMVITKGAEPTLVANREAQKHFPVPESLDASDLEAIEALFHTHFNQF